MNKIAIVGNTGAGKSVVARRLQRILHHPLHYVDVIEWRPGWKRADPEEIEAAYAAILSTPAWIIDGLGDLPIIDQRLREADTIVLIDYPLWRHRWWTAKRQIMLLFRPRPDGPAGCSLLRLTLKAFRMVSYLDRVLMPHVRFLVDIYGWERKTFHIRHPRELKALYAVAQKWADDGATPPTAAMEAAGSHRDVN